MRFVASVLVCIGIALATAGCDPVTDRKHFREGAGITLYADNGKAETQLQNQYIAYICEQAGVAVDTCGSGDTARLFVEAGMNDIDQRCDAYLTWLDMKRRDREPILRSLTQIGTATHTIMAASGAGTDSLEIVTAALGLASGLYSNWNSRLLLSVNQSTVQTLVYSRQWQFRDAIKNERVTGRPRAIYLLRNYLRICMPTTIEADINTSMTLVQRGNPMDAKNSPVVKTVVATRPSTSGTKVGSIKPGPAQTNPEYDKIIEGENKKAASVFYVQKALRALCVPDTEINVVTPKTLALIDVFEKYLWTGAPDAATRINSKLDQQEFDVLEGAPKCDYRNFRNYYERERYSNPRTVKSRTASLVRLLNSKIDPNAKLPDNATLDQARPTIAIVRSKVGLKVPIEGLGDQVTRDFLDKLE